MARWTILIRAAKQCSSSVFDIIFQYKIVTQILPTNKYLHRYKVKESDLCCKCLQYPDTIYHNLWECCRLTPYLTSCFRFLKTECNLLDVICVENYLFGFIGSNREGINHVLLELKKYIFYSWKTEIGVNAFCEHLYRKLRYLIIKEKNIAQQNDNVQSFYKKWENYTTIYDFRGTDIQMFS